MSMKNVLKPVAVAASVAAAGMTFPTVASAEMSASVAVSNFYLWRGQNLSQDDPAISGSLDYSHGSGAYAGIWVSSEGQALDENGENTTGQEVDIYAGFAGEAGGLSYDVSLVTYDYPGESGPEHWADFSEAILSFGMANASFTLYQSLQSISQGGGYTYYTLGYSLDKVSVTYGGWSRDSKDTNAEYAHLDLSFQASDELAFTISTIVDDGEDEDKGIAAMETDPLINVTWSKSFDL